MMQIKMSDDVVVLAADIVKDGHLADVMKIAMFQLEKAWRRSHGQLAHGEVTVETPRFLSVVWFHPVTPEAKAYVRETTARQMAAANG